MQAGAACAIRTDERVTRRVVTGLECKAVAEPNASADKPKSIWDNDLPAGDSPPLPRWPLTAAISAYALWMVFLVSMMVLRISSPN